MSPRAFVVTRKQKYKLLQNILLTQAHFLIPDLLLSIDIQVC